GTVVMTTGTTPLGAVDAIDEALQLQNDHSFRIHVDGAYGGFFKLLAETDALDEKVAAAYRAIPRCDSVVVDPHKHGLQPYGCGSVLFRDPAVGRFTNTIRPTRISPPTNCTSAKSASNARARA